MQRARDIIGLPVIGRETGKEVGSVQDLLFNKQWQYMGLLLKEKNFFHKGTYVPASAVFSFGTDCIMIGAEAITSFDSSSMWQMLRTGRAPLKGKSVVTACGRHLGFVADVYIEPHAGKIVGYELSDGFLSDMLDGRRMIRDTQRITLGEDTVVVENITDGAPLHLGGFKYDDVHQLPVEGHR
ncbi:uncharacterized protein YrrD [Aneurinibacillus soli]|uniref:PRC-barrel domain protein n=1 Tax=Aneurinibacillus soli TaxID=1500254 RepID=A0A0U4WE48_9BACL|nr:PRC-barrel domain-containing protein [Aneurinibacillus soli]PYE62486.1 uncharacterized protein YrrD [Aneurinibacillus soli]BAU27049.1 PRC-barrel domain protein [Aneurinibacillus soli]